MLRIITNDGIFPLEVDLHIKHKNNGMKVMDFKIDIHHPLYYLLDNERVLEYDDLYYLVKLNDDAENGTEAMIEAHLNTDDLKKIYFKHFITETKLLYEVLDAVLEGSGWTYSNAFEISTRRTIDIENCVAIDIINECMNIYNITYQIDNKNKVLIVVDPELIMDKGYYISDQVNLATLNCTSDTYDFCTCLKCFGETNEESGEELTFASINNGKDYVENFEHCDKVVWGTFKDDRFKDKESLLEAGIKELKIRANPLTSYSLTIINLCKLLPDKYYLLNFEINDIVTLKDHIRKKEIVEKIIEYDEYPSHPENDVITLSDQPLTIVDLESNVYDKVVEISNNVDKIQGTFLKNVKEISSAIINQWAEKGLIYMTENEIYVLDKLPKESAKYVIRINLGGIAFSQNGWQGPYISAWTIDGKFNADFIAVGSLRAVNIISGTITGETTVKVGTDIHAGNNLFLGGNNGPSQCIYGGNGQFIFFNKNPNGVHHIEITNEASFATLMPDSFALYNGNAKAIFLVPSGQSSFDAISASGNIFTSGDIGCLGKKTRIVKTKNYGMRSLSALESPRPMFEDTGSGVINSNGYCYIFFDSMFMQTINTECNYYVQLTKMEEGDIWCSEKHEDHFIVKGSEGVKFDWNVKAKQLHYETTNLDQLYDFDEHEQLNKEKKAREEYFDNQLKNLNISQEQFENEVVDYYEKYIKEQEESR